MAEAPAYVLEPESEVIHVCCDLCDGDAAQCPAPPYVFRKSWAQLIMESPIELKRECAGWHHGFARPGKRPEEFWSAYFNFEYVPSREW